jgi:hypothetical protein
MLEGNGLIIVRGDSVAIILYFDRVKPLVFETHV